MPPKTDACRTALQEQEDARRLLSRYENLVYAVSVALAGTLIALIVSVLWGNNPAQAVSALGGLVSGGALLFITKERSGARKRLKAAHDDVRRDCKLPGTVHVRDLINDEDSAFGNEGGLPDYAIDILTRD